MTGPELPPGPPVPAPAGDEIPLLQGAIYKTGTERSAELIAYLYPRWKVEFDRVRGQFVATKRTPLMVAEKTCGAKDALKSATPQDLLTAIEEQERIFSGPP